MHKTWPWFSCICFGTRRVQGLTVRIGFFWWGYLWESRFIVNICLGSWGMLALAEGVCITDLIFLLGTDVGQVCQDTQMTEIGVTMHK